VNLLASLPLAIVRAVRCLADQHVSTSAETGITSKEEGCHDRTK
jgi:hypothetical protein